MILMFFFLYGKSVYQPVVSWRKVFAPFNVMKISHYEIYVRTRSITHFKCSLLN